MKRNISMTIGIVVLLALIALISTSLFTVHQTQQAMVMQFGKLVRVIKEPGLNIKVPFLQQVEFFESRVLDYDAEPVELVLGDQKRLVVDTFSRYRIEDPLSFRQSVGSEGVFRTRLQPIVTSALRSVLGEASLFSILSEERPALMQAIQTEANRALQQFGVSVVDIRIKRADLPKENSEAIFRRMETEREREAKELRAQGAELAQRIQARAERERSVLLAEAERDAQIIRGKGDAEAVRIFADAFGQDADFFEFYRSMQAYRTALGGEGTSMVMSPNSDFLRYLTSLGDDAGNSPNR